MRLARAERREQILQIATAVFVGHGGYALTPLEDVAAAAGVSRMILYRHFESKSALYRATIDRAAARLHDSSTIDGSLHVDSVAGMLCWVHAEPEAFRLLFRHAAAEPEFRAEIDQLRIAMAGALRPHMCDADGPWGRWAAQLATTTAIEAILCWLDVGSPDPDRALPRILHALDGVLAAVHE